MLVIRSPAGQGCSALYSDAGHTEAYAVLALLWRKALGSGSTPLAISLLSTPLTELVQLLTPLRSPCLVDVLNNTAGVAAGYLLSILVEGPTIE